MNQLIGSSLFAALCGHNASAQAPDLLSFAQGAIPVRVQTDAAARVTLEQALRAIDGSLGTFVLARPVPASTRISLVYVQHMGLVAVRVQNGGNGRARARAWRRARLSPGLAEPAATLA